MAVYGVHDTANVKLHSVHSWQPHDDFTAAESLQPVQLVQSLQFVQFVQSVQLSHEVHDSHPHDIFVSAQPAQSWQDVQLSHAAEAQAWKP